MPLPAASLDLADLPGDWQRLLTGLREQSGECAAFEEARYRPFKRLPSNFAGEAHFAPELGLTLHYTQPVDVTYRLHAEGLTRINADGDRREFQQAEVQALAAVMRQALAFDWAALAEQYTADGQLGDGDWQLALSPRSEAESEALGYRTVKLAGNARELTRLELERSNRERVVITFTPCE